MYACVLCLANAHIKFFNHLLLCFSLSVLRTHQLTGNSPPNITGSFLLYVNSGESVSEMYNADDPDGDSISTFILKVLY